MWGRLLIFSDIWASCRSVLPLALVRRTGSSDDDDEDSQTRCGKEFKTMRCHQKKNVKAEQVDATEKVKDIFDSEISEELHKS